MFNLSKELFFSVPFYYYNIENTDELNRELVHHILKIKEEDEQGLVRSNNFGWHSKTNLSGRDEFSQITKIIHDALNEISTKEEEGVELTEEETKVKEDNIDSYNNIKETKAKLKAEKEREI